MSISEARTILDELGSLDIPADRKGMISWGLRLHDCLDRIIADNENLNRRLTALEQSCPAPVEAGPVVVLQDGQAWTKDRYAKDDECIALWFYDGGQCRAFHADARESRAVTTRARFEQDMPIDRVAPILRRFGFTVRDKTGDKSLQAMPANTECVVSRAETGGGGQSAEYRCGYEVGLHDAASDGVRMAGTGQTAEYSSGYLCGLVEGRKKRQPMRAALAEAPPPPGCTAPPIPDDATLRAAGWVKCPSREAISAAVFDAAKNCECALLPKGIAIFADAILALLGKDKP